ncbi:MAG: SCP2 sterol-binding domain-containing protein [Thermodesulfobacteriota bacterium]
MAVFGSTDQMYDVLGNLFRMLMGQPDFGQKIKDSDLIIYFKISEPDGEIWVTSDGQVICGPADLKPTVSMTLSGDTCHKFWLKQVSMPIALAKGLIKVKGPMPKVLKLLPLLKPAYEAYPDHARKHGIQI